MSEKVLRLGTRGSALARWQTGWVADRLRARVPGLCVEARIIRTTGDQTPGPLYAVGGKGLFIKEIEEAMLAGEIDAGVHSLKDLPAELPPGLAIVAVPEREDPRDVLVGHGTGGVAGLPRGARVGTGSLRRRAQLRHLRPDLDVVGLRGNVETRLRKWRDGEFDAVVIAAAGLKRLGLEVPEAQPLEPAEFLPAIGQGALAIEAPLESPWRELLRGLEHEGTAQAAAAERGFLEGVGGDCKTPVAAHARLSGGLLELQALIADPEGSPLVSGAVTGRAPEARSLGLSLAADLLARGGRAILQDIGR